MDNKEIDETRQGEILERQTETKSGKKLFLESYGCAMNFSDSEIVASILEKDGFTTTKIQEEADVIMINTCSIRDKAETTVLNRLKSFKKQKKKNPSLVVGVLGCMAERMKETLLEQQKLVDVVVGPDAYRDLPNLITKVNSGQKAVNVLLSREETYADISPVKLGGNGVTAFVSIMRGCDNMCSFCVVPFTRGRERSRNPLSIVAEVRELFENGYREVTLLGQNVNSYRWNISKKGEILDENIPTTNFAELLELVAGVNPDMRVRYSTSHPKDMGDDVLIAMSKHENICKYIHLPVQSGNSDILKKMNRGYTREWYMNRIAAIKRIMPDCYISTDIITGFCGETEAQHKDTMSIIEEVKYEYAYMFFYSERPKTLAERKFEDDIPEEVKKNRLSEIIELQNKNSLEAYKKVIGNTYRVLIEGTSKKSDEKLYGRNSQNSVIIFYKGTHKKGEYVNVKINDCTKATLFGEVIK